MSTQLSESGLLPEYLTIDEVAARLRLHRRTIKRLIARGELAAFLTERRYIIARSDVDAYVEDHRVVPDAPPTDAPPRPRIEFSADALPRQRGGRRKAG